MNLRVLLFTAALITYGSLYPFQFLVPEYHAAAWLNFFTYWTLFTSKGDVLGNIALFVPFGIACTISFGAESRAPSRTLAVLLASFLLATSLQMVQIYFPPRSPAIADIIWNMVGAGLGIPAAMALLEQKVRLWRHDRTDHALPVALISLWIAAELLPFVPSLDAQSVKNTLKALLHPKIVLDQLLFHAAGVIVAGRALAAMAGEARSFHKLLALAGIVVLGKVFVVTRILDVSTVLGFILGFATWRMLAHWPEPKRGTALLILLFVTYAVGALMPFEFREEAHPFNWLPFGALLQGTMLVNSISLAGSLFLYAGMLGLLRMSGGSPVPSSYALAMMVTLFEAMQIFLVGRTPDVTEPLLVLLIGQLLNYIPMAGNRPVPSRKPSRAIAQNRRAAARMPLGGQPVITDVDWKHWGMRAGIICIAMATAFAAVLRLPKVPYNVSELFLAGGAFPMLLIFAVALLWIGAGSRCIAYIVVASNRPWLTLPVAVFGAATVSLLLLCASVTQESIGDIAGSNNLYWFVVNRNIWGDWAHHLFLIIPSGFISFLERPVRYAALYSSLIVPIALMFAVIRMRERGSMGMRRILTLLVSAAIWMWMCKAVAFDWSSTDNLNELIARDGPWGWGGGGFLYALIILIGANAVLGTQMRPLLPSVALMACVTVAMLPVGWWLLNMGLEQDIHKYGAMFSGPQFLLGPDRKHALPSEVLFLRWSAVQLIGVWVIAAGARLAQPLIDRPPQCSSPVKSV